MHHPSHSFCNVHSHQLIKMSLSDLHRSSIPVSIKSQYLKSSLSALAGFHEGLISWSNRNLEMLVFVEGGRPEDLEKNLEARPQPTTNSTHIWNRAVMKPGPHWWARGKRSHHCAILALTTNRKGSSSLPFNSATDSATASRGGGSMALFKNSPMSPSLRSLMVRASS